MPSITPFLTTFRLADAGGIITREFKAFIDALLDRAGGVTGGRYEQLADGPSVIWDADQRPNAVVVLGGNRLLASPLNLVAGLRYHLTVVQDATGSRTLTYGSAFKFPGGTPPTLTAAANAVDVLEFFCDGTNLSLIVLSKDLR